MLLKNTLTSDFIKNSRLQLKLTQVELARILGVSFATVNRWEKGQTKPSKLAQQQIERFFYGSTKTST